MVYQWKSEYRRSSRARAQEVGEELEALGDNTTPEALESAARKRSSRMHDLFTWDDTEAAHQHRLGEAREILRNLLVRIERAGEADVIARAYYAIMAVSEDETEARVFVPMRIVANDEPMREQVLARALRDLQFWTQRYESLRDTLELGPIFEAVQWATKPKRKRRRAA